MQYPSMGWDASTQQQAGYPGVPGYPLQQQAPPGYPGGQQAYPAQQGAYPPQQGAYLPQQAGHPPQQGGYSPQQPGSYQHGVGMQHAPMPPAAGYPGAHAHATPGYTPPPMGHAAAVSNAAVISNEQQVVVAGPQYCYPHPVQLRVKEVLHSLSDDDFQIFDQTGRMVFKMDARAFSFKEKRTLLDCYGQPCLTLGQKPFSLRGTWVMTRGQSLADGPKLAEIRKKTFSISPTFQVFLNDGDKEPDFRVKGNFLAKKFEVIQVLSGGRERAIATVKKESQFSSAAAFMQSQMFDKQSYTVVVQPGVDAAFIVSLAVLADEFCHDDKE